MGLPRARENKVRMFGNMVLRRIYEPKREEVVERWRDVHNEELHSL
jgi:hypothetical protein